LIRIPLETVIVADDEELMEILDAADLLIRNLNLKSRLKN